MTSPTPDTEPPPPPDGHEPRATGTVTQRGRRLAHADAAVVVRGRAVATARAVFAVFQRSAA